MQMIHTCCLCQAADPAILGCFIPDRPEAFTLTPVPPGKRRVLWYKLCHACAGLPDTAGLVEAKLRGQMIARWN